MYIKLPGADVVLLTEGNIIGCDTASATWTRRGLRPWHVNTISTRERNLPSDHLPVSEWPAPGRRGVAAGDVRKREKSDSLIVAAKQANNPKGRSQWSEGAGPRGTRNSHMRRTQSRESMSQEAVTRAGSCEAAEEERFTALFHLLTVEALEAAFLSLSRKRPPEWMASGGWTTPET